MRKVKELDPYIKARVGEALIQLTELTKQSNNTGTSRLYYTGNWAKDIYDNYTEKQAEVIFKKVDDLKSKLTFFQSKLESFVDQDGKEWIGYDYYVKKL
jgi:hypothetical protein